MNKAKYTFVCVIVALLCFYVASCTKDKEITNQMHLSNINFAVPKGWSTPHYDFSTNPLTTAGFKLGRKLFYEKKLSLNNTISCGSCHHQSVTFSDSGKVVSTGINGLTGNRNAPSLTNLAWQTNFMWDGGINHIEVQPIVPISNPVEMGETLSNVINKLQSDAVYTSMFKEAFGTETITSQLLLKAMAQFTGMLVSSNSKYDLYTRGETSLSTSESDGLKLFQQKCGTCHTAPLFTNLNYINNGLDSVFADAGRGKITGLAADSGTFKVPSLRNVSLTSPYMHDGRFQTLEQVLEHYSNGIKHSASLSPLLANGIRLTREEKNNIISFLNTLTDINFIHDIRFNNPNP